MPAAECFLAGIGASAGGITALQRLFQAMPPDPDLSLVVVQHLAPGPPSQLLNLIDNWSSLPVQLAENGLRPKRNHVYLASPDDVLTLEDGVFHTRPAKGGNCRPGIDTIDAFMESLAQDRGPRALAVILSGTGADGAAGAICVKQAGGVVLVQDPVTATYDSMPRSVIVRGAADYILPIDGIATQLALCTSPAYVRPQDPVMWTGKIAKTLDEIVGLIRKQAGFDLSGYKATPLLWRIQQHMDIRRVRSFEDYESLLRDDPAELEALIRGIPIHVTEFFRDPAAWDVLGRDVIETLIHGLNGNGQIRAWTPACATGEEAYSVAMLLSEHAETAGKEIDFHVFATDAAPEVLARASRGAFSEKAVKSISAERRARFLYTADGNYRVKRSLREKMVFAPQDLLVDPPFAALDLVTCRNLLIYLDQEAVQRVLFLLHSSLRVGGYLFLGKGEPLAPRQKGFETVSSRWHIYRKVGPASIIKAKVPSRPAPIRHATAVPASAHRTAVEHFDLPSVLIDDEFHVLRVYGDTDKILRLPAGLPTNNLLELAQREFVVDLKIAAKDALADKRSVTVSGLRDRDRGDFSLKMQMTPIQTAENGNTPRLLVSFIRAPDGPAADKTADGALPWAYADIPDSRGLSEAVRISREELEASREELQALNEELRASNEQLNIANEDLNQVNTRLTEKVGELEMQSRVLSSGAVMTLFLDRDMCVRWFTPAVSELFPLMSQDIGRRITDFVRKFQDEAFVHEVGDVMLHGVPREAEVRSVQGRWFLRTIRPYRGETGTAGVAVTFTDITALKGAEEELRESQAQLAAELEDTKQLQRVSGLLIEQEHGEGLYEQILTAAMAIMRADFGSIQMLDTERGVLQLLAWRNFHPDSAAFWREMAVGASTSCGSALGHGERTVMPDVRTETALAGSAHRAHYALNGILAVQSTPLTTREGQAIGIISTHWAKVHAPGERELRLLDILAREAADVLEHRRAQKTLRLSEQRLQRVLETDAVGVIFFDRDGTVLQANQVFLGMTGYTREQIAANELTWQTMTPPEWLAVSEEQMRRFDATGRIGPYEKEYFLADGSRRWMLFAGRDLGDGTISEYCIDISDRKRMDAEMQARNDELERFNRVVVGRELRMIELKNEVNLLRARLGEPRRYALPSERPEGAEGNDDG